MSFAIGVDGGGTRTRAVVVDLDGMALGRGDFPGAVASAHEPERAADAVEAAVRLAAESAGVQLPAATMWAGLAGAGGRRARAAVTDALSTRGIADRLVVGTDVEAAFHDAFGTGEGVLLISGTGSIAWARGGESEPRQVGGWGKRLGDEGSGYRLGLEALQYLMRAHDGRAGPTTMTEPILTHLGVSTPPELVAEVGTASKSRIASLAPIVARLAEEGDMAAGQIVERAVEALLTHVRVAMKHGRAPDEAGGRSSVVLWGGIVADGGPLRLRMLTALESEGFDVLDHDLDPPMGAARLALSLRS